MGVDISEGHLLDDEVEGWSGLSCGKGGCYVCLFMGLWGLGMVDKHD